MADAECPLYPQKRTLLSGLSMSAKCQKQTLPKCGGPLPTVLPTLSKRRPNSDMANGADSQVAHLQRHLLQREVGLTAKR
jgi:hypothetical protein